MRTEVRYLEAPRTRFQRPSTLIPLAFLLSGVPWGIWSIIELPGGGAVQTPAYYAAAGSFVLLALGYTGLIGVSNMSWISFPVLITIEGVMGFAVIPNWRFYAGQDSLDDYYVHSMVLVLIGFAAFWVGSLLFMKRGTFRFVPEHDHTPDRVVFIGLAMLVLGGLGSYFLWRLGLLGYTAAAYTQISSIPFLQSLTYLANFMGFALIVSAIEVFGKRTPSAVMWVIFWAAFLFMMGAGLLSGMKSSLILPLISVAFVYRIIKGRFPRSVFLVPVFLVVLVYPFVSALRQNLNTGYRDRFNTVEGVEATLEQSFEDAFTSFGWSGQQAASTSSLQAGDRLNYLGYVRNLISLPFPEVLNGDEQVWMAPLYAVVPRFLWKSKPVQQKGVRLARLDGSPTGSAALTPIGDLYVLYGNYGVIIGMFIWGAGLQLITNWIKGRRISERSLCIFIIMLPIALNLEADVIGMITATIQYGIEIVILAYLIYGRSPAPLIAAESRGQLRAQ